MEPSEGQAGVVTISVSTADEASDILALQQLAYQSEARLYNDWSLPALTQSLESLVSEYQRAVILSARSDVRIVGSVRAALTGDTCEIGRLVVHPDFQGRGIGTTLLKEVERRFIGCRRYELFTGSKSAANIRLYQRNGYEISGTRTISDSASLTYLEKRVS